VAWYPRVIRTCRTNRGRHDRAVRRVAIIGTSGSGKSTLGAMLADRLGVPYIELDGIFYQPNWTQLPALEFERRVQEAAARPTWVIDGSYSAVRHVIWPRADCIVWLDLPRPLVTYRVLRRTVVRCATRQELWSGNRDRWRDLLSTDPRQSTVALLGDRLDPDRRHPDARRHSRGRRGRTGLGGVRQPLAIPIRRPLKLGNDSLRDQSRTAVIHVVPSVLPGGRTFRRRHPRCCAGASGPWARRRPCPRGAARRDGRCR
jgi:adenylate kinase family enzyme